MTLFKSKLKVAIGILSWNQFDLTKRCIESYKRSSGKDVDIYLIDNGSDIDVLRKERKIKGVSLIELRENYGYSGGFNKGINTILKRGNYDYLLITNNDLIVDKRMVSELIEDVKWCGGNNIYVPIVYFLGTEKRIQAAGMRSIAPSPFQLVAFGRNDNGSLRKRHSAYLSGACFLIKAQLFLVSFNIKSLQFVVN